jgi:hypothetical protein
MGNIKEEGGGSWSASSEEQYGWVCVDGEDAEENDQGRKGSGQAGRYIDVRKQRRRIRKTGPDEREDQICGPDVGVQVRGPGTTNTQRAT